MDFSTGRAFSASVWSKFGVSVTSAHPDDASSFWLLASFSRSKIKLNVSNVSFILQSVFGGSAEAFAVVELEDWIFKFSVSSKEVGLWIYKTLLDPSNFNFVVNLWNPNGIELARKFIASSQGRFFEWVQVDSTRKTKSVLTGANAIPVKRNNSNQAQKRISVFNRLNEADLQRNAGSSNGKSTRNSVFSRLGHMTYPSNRSSSSSHSHAFDLFQHDTNSDTEFAEPVGGRANPVARQDKQGVNGASAPGRFSSAHQSFKRNSNDSLNLGFSLGHGYPRPTGPIVMGSSFSRFDNGPCVRCMSYRHSKAFCCNSVRCLLCFRLGHIAVNCKFPPRFPGLTDDRVFSKTISPGDWSSFNPARWFRTPTRSNGPPAPRVFKSFGDFLVGINIPRYCTPSSSSTPWVARPIISRNTPEAHPAPFGSSQDPTAATTSEPPRFASFGDWDAVRRGVQLRRQEPIEVQWHLQKTSFSTKDSPLWCGGLDLDSAMAFCFVDPAPFMPQGGQRVMIRIEK